MATFLFSFPLTFHSYSQQQFYATPWIGLEPDKPDQFDEIYMPFEGGKAVTGQTIDCQMLPSFDYDYESSLDYYYQDALEDSTYFPYWGATVGTFKNSQAVGETVELILPVDFTGSTIISLTLNDLGWYADDASRMVETSTINVYTPAVGAIDRSIHERLYKSGDGISRSIWDVDKNLYLTPIEEGYLCFDTYYGLTPVPLIGIMGDPIVTPVTLVEPGMVTPAQSDLCYGMGETWVMGNTPSSSGGYDYSFRTDNDTLGAQLPGTLAQGFDMESVGVLPDIFQLQGLNTEWKYSPFGRSEYITMPTTGYWIYTVFGSPTVKPTLQRLHQIRSWANGSTTIFSAADGIYSGLMGLSSNMYDGNQINDVGWLLMESTGDCYSWGILMAAMVNTISNDRASYDALRPTTNPNDLWGGGFLPRNSLSDVYCNTHQDYEMVGFLYEEETDSTIEQSIWGFEGTCIVEVESGSIFHAYGMTAHCISGTTIWKGTGSTKNAAGFSLLADISADVPYGIIRQNMQTGLFEICANP